MKRSFIVTMAISLASMLAPARGDADVDTRASPNRLEMRGGASVLPLAQAMAERYMQDHPGTVIVVGGSRRGVKSTIVGVSDVAMSTSYMPPEYERLERERAVKLSRYDVFRDAVVVVVNPANKVSDLSMKQVRDVFRGAITNWKDLGGVDAAITVVTPNATSDVYETFKSSVLRDDAVVTPKALHHDYLALVKVMTDDVNAIGLVGGHGVGAMKPLSLNGVSPTEDDIKTERYPIFRILSLYVRQPVPPLAKDLIENYFLAGDKGQAFVRAKGDIPIR